MLNLFFLIPIIAFQNYVYSSENTRTVYIDQGDYAYPSGRQEYFNEEIAQHKDVKILNLVTSQWTAPVDLNVLSQLDQLESLNISSSGGWVPDNIPSTIPHIPSLIHLEIDSYYINEKTFENLNWIKLNPQLESLNLYVYFKNNVSDPLLPFTQLKKLRELKLKIDFRNININMSAINSFQLLKSLYIENCDTDDENLLAVFNLPKIEELFLEKSKLCKNELHISKNIFDQIKISHNLQHLFFKNALLDSIDFFRFAPNLTYLTLDSIKLSVDWRELQANKKLEILELFNIAFDPYRLEQINLASLPNVKIFRSNSAEGIDLFSFIPNVKELYLKNSNINEEDLQKISLLRFLEILDISNTSISSLNDLSNLQSLKKLYANNLKLNNGDITKLKNLRSLEELSLSGADLSLKQIESLSELSSLKLIDLSHLPNPNITSIEIDALRQKLPHTKIIFESLEHIPK